jgi:two-component system phosphate regulon sensor histidine kinase PhoR
MADDAFHELRVGFTAAVSHELRTPLARLMALLDSAALPDSDTDTLMKQARREVEHMSELVDDVLFLSELESGREVVTLTHTQAMPIVREIASDLHERAERADIAIQVSGDDDVELPVRPRMLRVLLLNLADNAIRYAGPRTHLHLTVIRVDSKIVLAAADDGPGVPPDELPRLFERFYRSDQARATRGTGLGLAIVKHIVVAAGGTVDAREAVGGGLEVRCVFTSS